MSFQNTLSHQHRSCDIALSKVEATARAGDWHRATTEFDGFLAETEAHFRYEETILFPALERAHPAAAKPVAVMRGEHAQIRELTGDLGIAIRNQRPDLLKGVVETLVFLLQQHNAKEESALYPLADQVLEPGLLNTGGNAIEGGR